MNYEPRQKMHIKNLGRELKFTSFLLAAVLIKAGASQAETLPDFGDLDLKLRTFFFNRDKDQDKADSVATAQAVRLDYVSPYVGGLIGVDGSLFFSIKLDGQNGEGRTFLLRDKANGDQRSYRKLGQMYVKVKLPGETVLKVGRMELDKPLLEEDDSRATPSSTQAIYLETVAFGTTFYAIVSDKASGKTEGKFFSYKASDGENFNITVIGADHKFDNGLKARVSYGYADDIMQQGYLGLSYTKSLPYVSTLKPLFPK
jgi:hypothetical protein